MVGVQRMQQGIFDQQLIEDNRRGDIPLLIKEEDSFGDTGQSN